MVAAVESGDPACRLGLAVGVGLAMEVGLDTPGLREALEAIKNYGYPSSFGEREPLVEICDEIQQLARQALAGTNLEFVEGSKP